MLGLIEGYAGRAVRGGGRLTDRKPDEAAWELLPELERQEAQIRERLNTEEASLLRTGVAIVDYAVDQVRFFREAWRALGKGLTDLQALERAELLSLPECLRQAETKWKQELVLKYALGGQWLCWQRALDARHPDSEVGVLPRHPGWPVPAIQLSPYRSSVALPSPSLVSLEADVNFAYGFSPGPIHPIRPLGPALGWTLNLKFFHGHRWNPLCVIVDPPWDLNLTGAQEAMKNMADRLQSLADSAATVPDPPPAGALAQWKTMAGALRTAADQFPSATPSQRAAIFQQCFALPGTIFFTPVAFVTEDMPPDMMAELIGFQLQRVGLLSVHEARRFEKFVELRHMAEDREITPSEARQLGTRLARFQRPLRRRSVTSYVRKVLKGLRIPRPRKERLGGRLRRLAAQFGVSTRTVYRRFGAFIRERGFRRDSHAVRLFARHLRRRSRSEGTGSTNDEVAKEVHS